MYRGTNHSNGYRPYTPSNQHVRPQGHYFQGNIRPYPSWQQRQTNNFQNVEFKYWCETCDKGFRSADHLENHKLQHQKCNIDGCQYVAHPKVITRHIQMQHSTDLFKKISKLNNPEEIQKWREERKRKYPTKENIEKKKAEINERIKRGEKMGMKRERGKNDNCNKGYANKGKQPHPIKPKHQNNLKRKFTSDLPQRREQDQKICKIVPPIEETRTLKPFAGIQHLINDDGDEIPEETNNTLIDDDDDFIHRNDDIKENNPETPICGALTSLLCEYGSSDEEEVQNNINLTSKENNIKSGDGNVNAKNSAKPSLIDNNSDSKASIVENNLSKVDTTKINQAQVNSTEKNNESDNESGPEEVTIVKDEATTAAIDTKISNVPKSKKANVSKIQNSRHMNIVKRKRKLPSTLLEKLLHKEIQSERNIILQCIRHIVNNNFYDNNK